ncbi:MAG TPA: hypothetical protein VJC00_00230 [Candidatus Nanoarchaeia archaeon]|nr:hypothetical protein [Candidatus Nanoarchaeia archaeon]
MADESLDSKVETVDESKRDFLKLGVLGALAFATGCSHIDGKLNPYTGPLHDEKGNVIAVVDYHTNNPRLGRWSVGNWLWPVREDNVLEVYTPDTKIDSRGRITGSKPITTFHDANGSYDPSKTYNSGRDKEGNLVIGDSKKDFVEVRTGNGVIRYSKKKFTDADGRVFMADSKDPVVKARMDTALKELEDLSSCYIGYMDKVVAEMAKKGYKFSCAR